MDLVELWTETNNKIFRDKDYSSRGDDTQGNHKPKECLEAQPSIFVTKVDNLT